MSRATNPTLAARATTRDRANRTARAERPLLSPRIIIGLVLVSLFAFGAIILMSGYAEDFQPEQQPFATATDDSAVGYTALRQLLDEIGVEASVDPYAADEYAFETVRLYFPSALFNEDRAARIPTQTPGLIVLPKWAVSRVERGSDEVVLRRSPGLMSVNGRILREFVDDMSVHRTNGVQNRLAIGNGPIRDDLRYLHWIDTSPPEEEDAEQDDETDAEAETADNRPAQEQTAQERQLREMMERAARNNRQTVVSDAYPTRLRSGDTGAGSVLYRVPDTSLMILAEPDLLNNHGLAKQPQAEAALAVLSEVARASGIANPRFVFDDNLRRRDADDNLIKLLTRPPFLAATLCLLGAGLLVTWQGFNRFGDPAVPETEARQGSATLAKSSAAFIENADRLSSVAPRYADVIRRQVIEALGLSVWNEARVDALIARREALRNINPTFDMIASDRSLSPMVRAERLTRWKEDITR